MTFQVFILNGSGSRYLMDENKHNPPQIIQNAGWLLNIKEWSDIYPMLVKPGGLLNHVQPDSVANERVLALFVRDEVLLPLKLQYKQCKFQLKRVRGGRVEYGGCRTRIA